MASAYEVTGTYKKSRGWGTEYSYKARWIFTDQGVDWNATVTSMGQVVGSPAGSIATDHSADVAKLVRDAVIDCIENSGY